MPVWHTENFGDSRKNEKRRKREWQKNGWQKDGGERDGCGCAMALEKGSRREYKRRRRRHARIGTARKTRVGMAEKWMAERWGRERLASVVPWRWRRDRVGNAAIAVVATRESGPQRNENRDGRRMKGRKMGGKDRRASVTRREANAPLSAARRSAGLATNAFVPPGSFECGCAALRSMVYGLWSMVSLS